MEADHSKPLFFLFLSFSFLLTLVHAEVHYHEFFVQTKTVKRLCKENSIVTVNGQFPGPTLEARNGDIMVIKVVNHDRHNVSIHWHGVKQMRNGWADGTAYVTQCPIKPGGSYTYKFSIEEQEGTLWWHAHTSWLRTTVYGALIIRPKKHLSYPFPKPQREFPIILGEWWTESYIEMNQQAFELGIPPKISDAIIVNGQPGDLYNCSKRETTVFSVLTGEIILLRFINAAMFTELFVGIAGHTMTVVGVDASYTKPFTTSVVAIGPGQTADVLVHANQPPSRYYMAAHVYASGLPVVLYDKTMTTAIFDYGLHPSMRPILPNLPVLDDKATVAAFSAGIKSPGPVEIPYPVDEHLVITFALGFFKCPPHKLCGGPNMTRLAGSMNNISFVLPTDQSLLQAAHSGLPGVFTTDFPASPLVQFDYTGNNISQSLWHPMRGTRLYKIKYGSVVQVVFQSSSIITAEQHLIHIHGYDFYVLATGTGNFDPKSDKVKFNLVDPPKRNTVAVPVRGWALIRFVADNPGVWSVHCHMDRHLEWGMAMAFLVENGDGEMECTLPPPPDLPRC